MDKIDEMFQRIVVNKSTAPNDVLETTQSLRLQLLDRILVQGVPGDRREMRMMTEVLRDMDTNALTTRKLITEEKAADTAAQISENVKAILGSLGGNANPFEAAETDPLAEVSRQPEIPEEIEMTSIAFAPGQTMVGVESLNYDDFVGVASNSE